MSMAKLVNIKETIRNYYQKHIEYLQPILKLVFSFLILCLVSRMFSYSNTVSKPWILLAISAVQAFLPASFLFYSASILVALQLWKLSLEILVFFLALVLICWLCFVRIEGKYGLLMVITAVLFLLKLEYLIPVLVSMTVGIGGILPVAGGILLYYFSCYTREAEALLLTTTGNKTGMAMQRIVDLLATDKELLVVLLAFALAMFISVLLYHMFHESAWIYTVVIGNVALALLLLSGRLVFELDYSIARLFLEIILAGILAMIYQFFEGIGDVTRIERVSFEDEEYIYFVKAVPKIKVTQTERNVTNINSAEETEIVEEEGEKTDEHRVSTEND